MKICLHPARDTWDGGQWCNGGWQGETGNALAPCFGGILDRTACNRAALDLFERLPREAVRG
eukprot:11894634-Prorocentrum_lima.AAC.1